MTRINRRPSVVVPIIDSLEPRRMFNAATLKHGLLTVYGSDDDNTITIADTTTPAAKSVTVTIDGQTFAFRSTGITRIRVFAQGGDDSVTLGDAYMPNVTDVSIDGGDGDDMLIDASLGHRYNRAESVSLTGDAGDDTLVGGDHTLSSDGGTGDDTVLGGAPGAILQGSDGNDLVSASSSLDIASTLTQTAVVNALSIDGGAGDDVLVGNYLGAGNAVTMSGGDGDDQFFNFATDTIVDLGDGMDQQLSGNQYVGNADVTQTATLSLVTNDGTVFPADGLGNFGAKPRIFVTDTNGSITMQGPTGSSFLLGDLLNAAGYPVSKLGIPSDVVLTVNGFQSSLTGIQIAGYQINNGDVIRLNLTGGD